MAYTTYDEELRRSAYKRPWMKGYRNPLDAPRFGEGTGFIGGGKQTYLDSPGGKGFTADKKFFSNYTPGLEYKSFEEALAVGKEARDSQDLEDYRRYAASFGVPATAQGFDNYRKEKHGERQQEQSAAQKNAAIARQQANQNREFALSVWKAKQANLAAAQNRQVQMAKARAQQARYSGGTPTGRGGGGGGYGGGGSRSVSSTNLPINRARKNAEAGVYADKSDEWIMRNVARLGGDSIDANYMIQAGNAYRTKEGRSAFTAGQAVVTARNTGEKKQVDAFEDILQSGRIDQLNKLNLDLISDNNRRILHSKLENYLHTQQDPNFYDNMEDAWERAKAKYDPKIHTDASGENPLEAWQEQYAGFHSSDEQAVLKGEKPSFYKKQTAFDIEKHPGGARYDVYDYSPFSELFPRPVGPGFDPIISKGYPELPPAQPGLTSPFDPDWEKGVDSPFGGTGPNPQTSPWGPDSPDDSSPMWQTPAAAAADIAAMKASQRENQRYPGGRPDDPILAQWERDKQLRAAGLPTIGPLEGLAMGAKKLWQDANEKLRMEDVQRRFMAGNVTPEERAELEEMANLWKWKKDAAEDDAAQAAAIDELNRLEERGKYATQSPLEHVGKNTMFVDPRSATDFGSHVEGRGVKKPWYGKLGTMPGEVASLVPEMVNATGQLINTIPTGALFGLGKNKSGFYYDDEGIPILRDMPVIGGMFGHGDHMTGPLPTEYQEEVRIPVLDNPAQYMESGKKPKLSPKDAEGMVQHYFARHAKARQAKGELEMADKAQMWQSAWSDLYKNYDVPAKEWIGRSEEIPDRVSALKAPREEIKPYTGGVPRTKRGQYLFNQGQSQESLVPPHKPRGGWPLRGSPVPPSPEDRELAEIQRRFMAGGATPEERANLEGQAYDYYKRKYPYLTDEELNKFISEPNTWWPARQ